MAYNTMYNTPNTTAGKGKVFVLTDKGYEKTPDEVKPGRKVGEPIKDHEYKVPKLWIEKGYVEERVYDIESRGKQTETMEPDEWDSLWDNNDKQNNMGIDNTSQKDIILVDVVHFDEHQYFKFEDIGVEEIKEQLRHTDTPMTDLTGELLTLPEAAQLEQSSKVSLSLTVNMDDRTVKVYETNNIPEDLRTDDNVSIKKFPMDEYLNEKRMPEKDKTSVLERLRQNEKKLQNRNPSEQEPIHRNQEAVK